MGLEKYMTGSTVQVRLHMKNVKDDLYESK